jgi:Spy/CpxP family protein refolding chaperone
MRVFPSLVTVAATIGVLAACSSTPVESAPFEEPNAEAVLETIGEGLSASAYLERAPESVRPTAEQKAQLRSIHTAFRDTNGDDWRAMRAIVRRAMEARRGGADVATVRGILMEAQPIRARLRPAFAQLRADVDAVLTDAQRRWLRENSRRMGPRLPTLPPNRG